MAKKKFYSYNRYTDAITGEIKEGYLPREGFNVPNSFGLDLAVYKAPEEKVKTWYVVDCRCGLAVGSGGTRDEAVENTMKTLKKVDWKLYFEKREKRLEIQGDPPGYRISYL